MEAMRLINAQIWNAKNLTKIAFNPQFKMKMILTNKITATNKCLSTTSSRAMFIATTCSKSTIWFNRRRITMDNTSFKSCQILWTTMMTFKKTDLITCKVNSIHWPRIRSAFSTTRPQIPTTCSLVKTILRAMTHTSKTNILSIKQKWSNQTLLLHIRPT